MVVRVPNTRTARRGEGGRDLVSQTGETQTHRGVEEELEELLPVRWVGPSTDVAASSAVRKGKEGKSVRGDDGMKWVHSFVARRVPCVLWSVQ